MASTRSATIQPTAFVTSPGWRRTRIAAWSRSGIAWRVDGHGAGVEADGRAVDEVPRKAVAAPEQPHRSIGRQRRHLGVEHDRRRVRRRLPALRHRPIGGRAGRILVGGNDDEWRGVAEQLPERGRRLARIEPAERVERGVDVQHERRVVASRCGTAWSARSAPPWLPPACPSSARPRARRSANGAPGCVCVIVPSMT